MTSERLLFSIKWAIFQLVITSCIRWDYACFILDGSRPTLYWKLIVVAYWNNSPWVDMSLYSNTSCRSWANSLFKLILFSSEFLVCRGFILLNTLYIGTNKLLSIFSEMSKGFREVEIIFMSESLIHIEWGEITIVFVQECIHADLTK